MKLFRAAALALALAGPCSFIGAASAADEERYAAILIDADTGEVLHARYADRLRHPASLTKLMTLYLAFEDLRDGEAGFGDQLRISAHAAASSEVKIVVLV